MTRRIFSRLHGTFRRLLRHRRRPFAFRHFRLFTRNTFPCTYDLGVIASRPPPIPGLRVIF